MSDKRLRIGLNGFGRIGRCVTRILADRDDIDLGKPDHMLILVHGRSVTDLKLSTARRSLRGHTDLVGLFQSIV